MKHSVHLTSRCSQPLTGVQQSPLMTKTSVLQSTRALISGG
jgi:hypothetical protein